MGSGKNYLSAGALWGVFVSGSPLSPERFSEGVRTLEHLGFRVKCPLDPSIYYGRYDHGFSNGSVLERTAALEQLLEDPEVEVILAARGGYGAYELLPSIDFSLFRSNPKPLVGCSDLTLLLVQPQVCGIHGPTLGSSFADYAKDSSAQKTVDRLIAFLSDAQELEYQCSELRSGHAEGRLLCGNLSVLTSLLGTPWDVDYRDAVLVLEEVGEAPYRIHRSLLQLKHAGKLEKLAGLVFGRFSRCEAAHGPTADEVILSLLGDILHESSYPVYTGLEVGHWGLNLPLPQHRTVALKEGKITLVRQE